MPPDKLNALKATLAKLAAMNEVQREAHFGQVSLHSRQIRLEKLISSALGIVKFGFRHSKTIETPSNSRLSINRCFKTKHVRLRMLELPT